MSCSTAPVRYVSWRESIHRVRIMISDCFTLSKDLSAQKVQEHSVFGTSSLNQHFTRKQLKNCPALVVGNVKISDQQLFYNTESQLFFLISKIKITTCKFQFFLPGALAFDSCPLWFWPIFGLQISCWLALKNCSFDKIFTIYPLEEQNS